jgi:hypothetical protein
MINPTIDCRSDLGPSDWAKMNRWQLEMFAQHGNDVQKKSLVDYGYGNLPAWQFEYLFEMAYKEPWQQD